LAEVTRHEFNGLGERVNKVELKQAQVNAETERNSQDVQVLFSSHSKALVAIQELALNTAQANSKLGWKIAGLVSIPTLFSVIQIAMIFIKDK